MNDLISRQAAIDGVKILHEVAWKNWHEPTLSANVVIDMIKDLPSAQLEIIRCKDCKHWEQESICDGHCLEIDLHHVDEDHYCSYAERREE